MAVTQISQIQIRYGLQEDIGTLAAGEFAWAIDTQRLFIGNGSVEEGAPLAGMTEIMTSSFELSQVLGPYTYKGYLGGYQVVTGPDSDTPIVRNLQDKIDDFVNVRDYGVSSLGNVDVTESLQRAINETYNRMQPATSQRTRRAIRLNAGTYRIDGELKIPPYATFIGEGIESVKLVLHGASAKLVTSTYASASDDVNIGEYPKAIHFKGLTISRYDDTDDCLVVDGSNNIVFEDVAFVGPRVRPSTVTAGSCVVIKSTFRDTASLHFNRCSFSGLSYAALIESTLSVKEVTFNNCQFNDLWGGIRVNDLGGTVRGIKVSNCLFADLYSSAIYGTVNSSGITSIGNTYINCASGYEGDDLPSSPWQPILAFQSNGNYSFMDVFARTPANSRLYPRVSGDEFKYSYFSLDEYFSLGSANYYAGLKHNISDGTAFSFPVASITHGSINYSLERDTMSRIGTISFVSKDQNLMWSEDYVSTDDLGVELSLSIDNSHTINLNGTTTALGSTTKLSFDVKNLA